jgi:hypothetical protein
MKCEIGTNNAGKLAIGHVEWRNTRNRIVNFFSGVKEVQIEDEEVGLFNFWSLIIGIIILIVSFILRFILSLF